MPYLHRADYVPGAPDEPYVHFNRPAAEGGFKRYNETDQWNALEVSFLPARFTGTTKCSNVYIQTKVNGSLVYQGEIKTGSRTSRKRRTLLGAEINPERDVYANKGPDDDYRLRLLAHWGSKVYYRSVEISHDGK